MDLITDPDPASNPDTVKFFLKRELFALRHSFLGLHTLEEAISTFEFSRICRALRSGFNDSKKNAFLIRDTKVLPDMVHYR
jgi:hypothetical protein